MWTYYELECVSASARSVCNYGQHERHPSFDTRSTSGHAKIQRKGQNTWQISETTKSVEASVASSCSNLEVQVPSFHKFTREMLRSTIGNLFAQYWYAASNCGFNRNARRYSFMACIASPLASAFSASSKSFKERSRSSIEICGGGVEDCPAVSLPFSSFHKSSPHTSLPKGVSTPGNASYPRPQRIFASRPSLRRSPLHHDPPLA